MKNLVYNEIKSVLNRDFALENPKDKSLAHFATPLAFSLAKELKKAPNLIANELAAKFEKNAIFASVEAVNGYLNFKLSHEFLNDLANKALNNPSEFGKNAEKKDTSFLLEYVSANPTGPLHIGHARGAIYGDTLARVARHLGYKFDTEYYINDAGKQIYSLGLSVFSKIQISFLKKDIIYPENCYKGDYIDDVARLAFEKFSKEFDESFFEDEKNIPLIAEFAKDEMLKLIKKDLSKARVEIDNFVSEKSYYNELENTLDLLRKNEAIYELDGKIWLKSTQKGDDKDRVIINENGGGTYLAADIVYHKDKMSRGYTKNINIWGADHHGYIPRMKAAMEFLGFNSDDLEIILAQMVSLLKDKKPYKMSKRAGNFILMSEVTDEIGPDALRFIFLSKKCDTHLEFDVSELKKQDSSNPVFYINYAYARINQLFAKANKIKQNVLNEDFKSLNNDALNLAFEALSLNAVLNDAFESRELQKICTYLKALAASFHKFYNENKIVSSENEAAFLKLFALVALALKTGFDLMGIVCKEKM